MKVYLMRHSDAESGVEDHLRRLTEKGQQQSKKTGNFLKNIGVIFSVAYTSPLIRAKETAEIVVNITNGDNIKIIETNALLNDASQKEFENIIKSALKYDKVLMVSHSPSIDERLRRLLGCVNPDSIKFPKAGVACVETVNGEVGTLEFFINPKII